MTSTPAASPWSGLREAAEAATYPGEWHVWDRGIGWEVHFGPDPSDHECDHAQCRSLMDWDFLGKGVFSETMARYLAAANPSVVLRLIEERDRLAEAIEKLFSETMAQYLAAANPSVVLRLIEERDRLAEALDFRASVEFTHGFHGGDLLRGVAAWMDKVDARDGNPDHTVQTDLRRWADGIDAALSQDREGAGE